MTLLQLTIQNYWERIGSFKGIELSELYNEIVETAQQDNLSVIEFLYKALGYKYGNLSYQESYELALRYYNGEKISDKNLFEELKSDLGKISTQDNKVLNTLSLYYRNCIVSPVFLQDNELSFLNWVTLLSSKKLLNNQMLQSSFMQSYLVTEVKKVDDNSVAVKNGVLYCKKDITEKKLEQLNKKAILKAIMPLDVDKSVLNHFEDLPILSLKNQSNYKRLLLQAASMNSTYKQLLASIGVSINDQVKAYLVFGKLFYILKDTIYFVNEESCENKGKLLSMTKEDFYLKLMTVDAVKSNHMEVFN